MSDETLATVKDFDDKIAQLTEERDRAQRLLEDPEQRTKREKLRAWLTGIFVMNRIRQGHKAANTWLPPVIKSAGEQSWVFSPEVLRADGYMSAPDGKEGTVWSRPGQS